MSWAATFESCCMGGGDISSDKGHNSEHFGHFRFPIPAANWQFLIKVWTYVIGLSCLLRTMLEYQKVRQVWMLQYGSVEKIGLEFFPQKNSKGLSIFSIKIRVFGGVKPGPLGPPTIHLTTHEQKIGGCYQKYWIIKWNVQKSHISFTIKVQSM